MPEINGIEVDHQEFDHSLDDMLDNDPVFRAMMEAMSHADDTDLDDFEYALVGSVAEAAAEGISETEWLAALPFDQPVQIAAREHGIRPGRQLAERVQEAIPNLRYYGLWPWA